jgi:hypothetical protein
MLQLASPYIFKNLGVQYITQGTGGGDVDRKFLSFFGLTPMNCYRMWQLVGDDKCDPKHLLWALMFLRMYLQEDVICTIVGESKNTVRKWTWRLIEKIAEIDSLVSTC